MKPLITPIQGVLTAATMMPNHAQNVPAALPERTMGRPGAMGIANGRVENAWKGRHSCVTLHIAADLGERAMPAALLMVHRGPSWGTATRQGCNSIDI